VVIAGAEDELQAIADWLGAPVASTVSGHGSLSDQHPLAVGVVGSNGGTGPTRAIVEIADLVVFVGCRAGSVTTERWRFPAPGKVKIRAEVGVRAALFLGRFHPDRPRRRRRRLWRQELEGRGPGRTASDLEACRRGG
jgi:Thiamine pyrophosphate enzyme, central domain